MRGYIPHRVSYSIHRAHETTVRNSTEWDSDPCLLPARPATPSHNHELVNMQVFEKPRNPLQMQSRRMRFLQPCYDIRYIHTVFDRFQWQA